MMETIIAALLPIVVTLMLGFFAGWHHDFDAKQASVLNRMVMLYALPLILFAGMMGIDRTLLLDQGPMGILLMIGLVGSYFLILLIAHFIFRQSLKVSALLALAIAGPAVPFVGVPVLGFLFGGLSAIPIALSSILMNLVQVPVTLFILSRDDALTENKKSVMSNLKETLTEPVVWAPILAFILLLTGVKIPTEIRSSMQLLGDATGGVAMFASGIILYSFHVTLNTTVALSVVVKNVLIPAAILGFGLLFGFDKNTINISVMTIAIPTASIAVILAVQYKTAEQEMASILFASTILSIITMGGFLYYLH